MASDDQQSSMLEALQEIQRTQALLVNAVESLSGRSIEESGGDVGKNTILEPSSREDDNEGGTPSIEVPAASGDKLKAPALPSPDQRQQQGFTSRIILTTYPKQIGINPLPMDWGNQDPVKRGPIVVSRAASTIRRRNGSSVRPSVSVMHLLEPSELSITVHFKGNHAKQVVSGGSYSIYYALAVASNELNADHRPDFTNTEPAANIGPFPQWGDPKKIVAMDPWGHLAPWLFKDTIEKDNVDIRPTIAITKAHMKLPELAESVKAGRLIPDGKVCLNDQGELAVTKFAVEPLITRGDIKVFLPPIGGLTVYCFGDPAKMSDESVRLSLRIHDECNGSDVFGSDICTCRPYLIFGIEEAVKEAQNGGSGVVIYFRKEGRALGEVTKIWGTNSGVVVYNARKRGADRASDYFKRTENIAGVKDMRFQALMPDILHWLGIKKIDRMLSMSNMKHDAIVGQGIPIHERVELPEELIPADSRVEIDAKITAGYFTTGKRMTTEELQAVQGRIWEDFDH
ncbi:hypothetical protein FGADI_1446 [Fusarium gaditjirri]|uniref:GTP cyclohydrolase II n=1 Tax=Fusarium gaditjirri TaxID=282569 RepID=A0A8H4X2V7_9HYPO|nr:hypothetical protein FGADI_1446 [Fusarium gaditjirri]